MGKWERLANEDGPDEDAQHTDNETDEDDFEAAIGSNKKLKKLGYGGVALVIAYLLAWPVFPSINATPIDYETKMFKSWVYAEAVQSNLLKWFSPYLSSTTMCEVVEAWAEAAPSPLNRAGVTCTDEVLRSHGSIQDRQFLWSEMRGVKHRGKTQTFCFSSEDGGRTWALHMSIWFMNVVPEQTTAKSCTARRALAFKKKAGANYSEVADLGAM